MKNVLVAHLTELKTQANEQLNLLSTCLPSLPECAQQHHALAVRLISKTRGVIDVVLQDPDLGDPALAANFYISAKGIGERLRIMEDGLVLALSRFSEADARFTRLMGLILSELNWPYGPLLGSALSTMHYYTITGDDLIVAPALESSRLLSIADIYHEFAHFPCIRDEAALGLAKAITAPLVHLAGYAVQQNWPTTTRELILNATQRWVDNWKVEVACDLIATYWLGPAYAWTNLRLCFARSDVFGGVDSHPADHARQMAIEKMLEKMGFHVEQSDVHKAWAEMLTVSRQTKPQTFDVEYPQPVLDALVSTVHTYCVSKAFAIYDPGKLTVAALINQAWVEFINDPAKYVSWETKAVHELEKRLPV
jgi:hypothetical protein